MATTRGSRKPQLRSNFAPGYEAAFRLEEHCTAAYPPFLEWQTARPNWAGDTSFGHAPSNLLRRTCSVEPAPSRLFLARRPYTTSHVARKPFAWLEVLSRSRGKSPAPRCCQGNRPRTADPPLEPANVATAGSQGTLGVRTRPPSLAAIRHPAGGKEAPRGRCPSGSRTAQYRPHTSGLPRWVRVHGRRPLTRPQPSTADPLRYSG
jgi:hypothetical protein